MSIIIDDDPISNLVTQTVMRKNDFAEKIKVFEKPQKALEYFQNEHDWSSGAPDIIFLDLQMPEIDGWGFLDRYADINPLASEKANIILLSATFDPEDEARSRSHPLVLELISKPVNKTTLERLT